MFTYINYSTHFKFNRLININMMLFHVDYIRLQDMYIYI